MKYQVRKTARFNQDDVLVLSLADTGTHSDLRL